MLQLFSAKAGARPLAAAIRCPLGRGLHTGRVLSAEAVPDVFVNFGVEQQFRFINHPGVMAVSKLLEMRFIAKPRANFTQENIEAMKEFDLELARKAQIAMDNNLSINMKDLESIEANLPKLLEDKKT